MKTMLTDREVEEEDALFSPLDYIGEHYGIDVEKYDLWISRDIGNGKAYLNYKRK
jgi:hypothetical protein